MCKVASRWGEGGQTDKQRKAQHTLGDWKEIMEARSQGLRTAGLDAKTFCMLVVGACSMHAHAWSRATSPMGIGPQFAAGFPRMVLPCRAEHKDDN